MIAFLDIVVIMIMMIAIPIFCEHVTINCYYNYYYHYDYNPIITCSTQSRPQCPDSEHVDRCTPLRMKRGGRPGHPKPQLPISPQVVPYFCGSYLESYKVIPKKELLVGLWVACGVCRLNPILKTPA